MKCFLLATITISFIEFLNSYVTQTLVIEKHMQQDNLESNQNISNDTLLFAQVIFRHGDRNIVKQYPNDPYRDEIHWPGGFGQLTLNGKLRSYEVGQFFRRRYDKLLGDEYSPRKVYIQSTDFDRSLCSAQTALAGLFPPTELETWNKNIWWQPIPVHTTKLDQDHVLAATKYCPKYYIAYVNYTKNDPEVQRIYRDYAGLFLQWSQMAGTSIRTTIDVYFLHNTISIEREQHKPLPDWVEKSIEGPMKYITEMNFKLGTNTPLLARLKYGFLLKELLEHFTQKIDGTLEPNRLLWLYSAQDVTISGVLNMLGMFELHILPYSCSLHFEMYKTNGNEHYIQIFYRKSEEEYPVPMEIPHCGTKCSLTKLYELYKEIIPDNFNTECF